MVHDLAACPSVIIPAFNAPRELDRCLQSVAQTVPAGTEVIVIDDASTDPATGEILAGWSENAGSGWKFAFNPRNLGFVGTVNRGLRDTAGDVVLLNADTEVTRGWLEGLARCLASDAAIATATPWTNNGEIASMPGFCAANPPPADLRLLEAAWSDALVRSGPPLYPDIPTAVGFCMAIARRAIDRIGLFDERLFGRGYGEENDFCMRAQAAGLRNVLCDDVYVVHLGGRSFGPLGLKPGEDSMRRLLTRHPGYLEQVQAFIAADPLAPRRQAIVEALERAGCRLG